MEAVMMNKTLATLALVLLLSAGSCTPPAEPSEPLVLPYPLYEQEYRGNQVTVALKTYPESSDTAQCMYRFDLDALLAEGETKFGVYVITVVLTEGYREGRSVDWNERIGDQTGSGWLQEGENPSDADTGWVAYPVEASGGDPVAVFVRFVAADLNNPGITYEERQGPVAVLQFLPDCQGVVRLDE
jgi:hypothetical protein